MNLLKDDERLRNERARALKAKERFAQTASGFGSDGGLDTPTSPKYPAFRGEWGSKESSTLNFLVTLQHSSILFFFRRASKRFGSS